MDSMFMWMWERLRCFSVWFFITSSEMMRSPLVMNAVPRSEQERKKKKNQKKKTRGKKQDTNQKHKVGSRSRRAQREMSRTVKERQESITAETSAAAWSESPAIRYLSTAHRVAAYAISVPDIA
eukprot:1052513-Rhodomonas_salina.1